MYECSGARSHLDSTAKEGGYTGRLCHVDETLTSQDASALRRDDVDDVDCPVPCEGGRESIVQIGDVLDDVNGRLSANAGKRPSDIVRIRVDLFRVVIGNGATDRVKRGLAGIHARFGQSVKNSMI